MITLVKKPYSRDAMRFFRKVLRVRVHLVESGRSKRPAAEMRAAIDRLMPYKDYSFTDRGAATFILKKHDDILRMIPPQAEATLKQFRNLVTEARYFLKYNTRMPV